MKFIVVTMVSNPRSIYSVEHSELTKKNLDNIKTSPLRKKMVHRKENSTTHYKQLEHQSNRNVKV